MKNLTSKIKSTRILVVGDMMLDLYLRGKASRISPEAPVPVVLAEHEDKVPGGAANVIVNLCDLGCQVTGVGFIGNDDEGDFLVNTLDSYGVNTEVMTRCSLPTIHKTRVLANGQHVVRFDFDSDFRDLKKEQNNLADMISVLGMSRRFDAVIVSDYCKGTVTLDLMNSIKASFSCPVICDTKPQNKDLFYKTYCITPNILEAKQMLGRSNGMKPLELAKALKEELELQSIIITMAEDGILCVDEKNDVISYPAHVEIHDHDPRQRFDVTGAGDTVISVFTACMSAGYTMQESVLAANIAAGVVVRKVGTASCSFEELVAEFENEGSTA